MTGRVTRTFVWGLKRSGIHLIVGWLYANHGGDSKQPHGDSGLHPQLRDGFRDPHGEVAFFNNCGGFSSRQLDLGPIDTSDLERVAWDVRASIFGIEDCTLQRAGMVTAVPGATQVLVLRDPLNHVASRLAGAVARPEVFRVDGPYLDLLDEYCAEYLGHTRRLPEKVTISFNRFVVDRAYRDALAAELRLENRDLVSEVSPYGGGSSFGEGTVGPEDLTTRFRRHPLPPGLVEQLLAKPSVQEVCATVFGYDLATLAGTS